MRVEARLTLRKLGFLLGPLTASLMPASFALFVAFDESPLCAFVPLIALFVVLPIVDRLVGRDTLNLDDDGQRERLRRDRYYDVLLYSYVPIQLGHVVFGAYVFATHLEELGPIASAAWLVAGGAVSGIIGITPAHELIHRRSRLERGLGGILLTSVLYPAYKIQHVWGHHVDVGTSADASSAPRGQSFYLFAMRAILVNVRMAFVLERRLLSRRGHGVLSWRHELVWWHAAIIAIGVAFYLAIGPLAVAYFVAQGVLAMLMLEAINYVEHYGLVRRKLEDGNIEKVTTKHSWNCDFLISNLVLLHLQRHADHHVSTRNYPELDTTQESPQLPGGYAAMIPLALVPPLWRRVMDARLDAYEAANRLVAEQ